MQKSEVPPKRKWKMAGILRLSRSGKVVLLAIWSLDSQKWLIVDVAQILDVIAGYRQDTPILEPVED